MAVRGDQMDLGTAPACGSFAPNVWRPTLCSNCYRGLSEHAIAREAGIEQRRWQYAIYEGGNDGFSSEQMHHWVTAGHLDASKLLIRRIPEDAEDDAEDTRAFQPLGTIFPDAERAFVPNGMDVNAWTLLAHRLAAADGKLAASKSHASTGASTSSASARRGLAGASAGDAGAKGGSGGRATGAYKGAAASAGTSAATQATEPDTDGAPRSEAFSRAEIDASGSAVASYFHSGDAWYYLDASNEQHGPFTGSKMAEWFRGGFLWQRKLQVGHDGWPSFSLLQEIVDEAMDDLEPPEAEPAQVSQAEPAAATPEQAPAASASIGEAEEAEDDAIASPDQQSVVEASPTTEEAHSAAAVAGLTAATAASSGNFVYMDDEGVLQGPFPRGVMAGWAAEGMLPGELMVSPAREGHEQGQRPEVTKSWFRADDLFEVPGEEDEEQEQEQGDVSLEDEAAETRPATPPPATAEAPHPAPIAAVQAGPPVFTESTIVEYLDDAGDKQGPFDVKAVRDWISQGFFTADTRIRQVGSQSWSEMQDHFTFDDRD